LPQPPQFLRSFKGSVQVPPQVVRASGQTQVAFLQLSTSAHSWPQLPQLEGSFRNCTQESGVHMVRPMPQLPRHRPWLQNWLALQALPQLPQFS
jgi:hypothetical protein